MINDFYLPLQKTSEYAKNSIQYGHKINQWNKKMAPYIQQDKYGYHEFNLMKTKRFLKLAGDITEEKAKKKKKILFVGTTKITSSIVLKNANRVNSYYINSRWLGGMLTNWSTIKKQIEKLHQLEKSLLKNNFNEFSKKEFSRKKNELEKLKYLFDGIKCMDNLPDLVIFTNQYKEIRGIYECSKLGIPCICIIDSNCEPDLIPFPIPANDDSATSINFILKELGNRILSYLE